MLVLIVNTKIISIIIRYQVSGMLLIIIYIKRFKKCTSIYHVGYICKTFVEKFAEYVPQHKTKMTL